MWNRRPHRITTKEKIAHYIDVHAVLQDLRHRIRLEVEGFVPPRCFVAAYMTEAMADRVHIDIHNAYGDQRVFSAEVPVEVLCDPVAYNKEIPPMVESLRTDVEQGEREEYDRLHAKYGEDF